MKPDTTLASTKNISASSVDTKASLRPNMTGQNLRNSTSLHQAVETPTRPAHQGNTRPESRVVSNQEPKQLHWGRVTSIKHQQWQDLPKATQKSLSENLPRGLLIEIQQGKRSLYQVEVQGKWQAIANPSEQTTSAKTFLTLQSYKPGQLIQLGQNHSSTADQPDSWTAFTLPKPQAMSDSALKSTLLGASIKQYQPLVSPHSTLTLATPKTEPALPQAVSNIIAQENPTQTKSNTTLNPKAPTPTPTPTPSTSTSTTPDKAPIVSDAKASGVEIKRSQSPTADATTTRTQSTDARTNTQSDQATQRADTHTQTQGTDAVNPRAINYAKQDWMIIMIEPALKAAQTQVKASSNPQPTPQAEKTMKVDGNGNQPPQDKSTVAPSKLFIRVEALRTLSGQTVNVLSSRPMSQQAIETLFKQLPADMAAQLKQSAGDPPKLHQVEIKRPNQPVVTFISPKSFTRNQPIQLTLIKVEGNVMHWQPGRPQTESASVLQRSILQYEPSSKPLNTLKLSQLTQLTFQFSGYRGANQRVSTPSSSMQQLAIQTRSAMQPSISSSAPPLAGNRPDLPLAVNQPKQVAKLQQAVQALMSERKWMQSGQNNPSFQTAAKSPASQPSHTSTITPPITQASLLANTPLTEIPKHVITQGQPLNGSIVKTALTQSGQEFEAKLLISTAAKPATEQSAPKLDLQRGFNVINQNIQAGIKQWFGQLTQSGSEKAPVSISQQTTSTSEPAAKSATPNSNTETALQQRLASDLKGWLVQHQIQLMQNMQTQPNGRPEQKQLMDGLLRVLFPQHTIGQITKTSSSSQDGEPVIPRNLSVQPHLQKLFTQLLAATDTSSTDETQQLRQLLSLTQTLTRIQHDQILNRAHQVQQPDQPDVQLSLPYLHNDKMHWCEVEYDSRQGDTEQDSNQRGWHVILRFAQQVAGGFAVEASLTGHQLSLSLWSEDQARLKQLHDHIDLLREKMIAAGFTCEHIQSKHGMPPKKTKNIQQGLVDVRT